MGHAPFMNTLCRGLVGYISYQATCDLSTIYSEYLLYGPIARIAKSQGYGVSAEYPSAQQIVLGGDKKRIDFKLAKSDETILVEVKWAKKKKCKIRNDLEKLRATPADEKYLLVFGQMRDVDKLEGADAALPKVAGKVVNWESGRTNYAGKWFRI